MGKENIWKSYAAPARRELERISDDYKACLDAGKTERECVKLTVDRIEKKGYKSLESVLKAGQPLKSGDKVYAVCRTKPLRYSISGNGRWRKG